MLPFGTYMYVLYNVRNVQMYMLCVFMVQEYKGALAVTETRL